MADEKNTAVEAKAEAAGKKGISEEKLEIIIAILLGVIIAGVLVTLISAGAFSALSFLI